MITVVCGGKDREGCHTEFLILPCLSCAPPEQRWKRKEFGQMYELLHFSQLVVSPKT